MLRWMNRLLVEDGCCGQDEQDPDADQYCLWRSVERASGYAVTAEQSSPHPPARLSALPCRSPHMFLDSIRCCSLVLWWIYAVWQRAGHGG